MLCGVGYLRITPFGEQLIAGWFFGSICADSEECQQFILGVTLWKEMGRSWICQEHGASLAGLCQLGEEGWSADCLLEESRVRWTRLSPLTLLAPWRARATAGGVGSRLASQRLIAGGYPLTSPLFRRKIPLKLLEQLKFSSEILTENQCGIIWSPKQKPGFLQAAASWSRDRKVPHQPTRGRLNLSLAAA